MGLPQRVAGAAFTTVPMPQASRFTSAAADAAIAAFNANYVAGGVPSTQFGAAAGSSFSYWQWAHAVEANLLAFERSGNAAYSTQAVAIMSANDTANPNPLSTVNFNDDLLWWVGVYLHAYDLGLGAQYLTKAQTFLDDTRAYINISSYSGGMWWMRSFTLASGNAQKNVATNGQFVDRAVRMFQITLDTGYLEDARRVYNWTKGYLVNQSRVFDNVQNTSATIMNYLFTYNYGNMIGAALSLYQATGGRSYLRDAVRFANWTRSYCVAGGVLFNEGNGDAYTFRAITCRQLTALSAVTGDPQWREFVRLNASEAWARRRADNTMGPDLNAVAPTSAQDGRAVCTQATLLQIGQVEGFTGARSRPLSFPGETMTVLSGTLGFESVNGSFTDSGYLAGWGGPNLAAAQTVGFDFVSATAQAATLSFRYATGGGAATSRQLAVNGAAPSTLSFPGTGGYTVYQSVSVQVPAVAGVNHVELSWPAGQSAAGYLNLDDGGVALAAYVAPTSAPTLTIAAGNQSATLSFAAPTGGATVSIFRGATSGGEAATPVQTGLVGSSWTDTGLTNGTPVFYQAVYTNAAGTSARSNEATTTPSPSPNRPASMGVTTAPMGWYRGDQVVTGTSFQLTDMSGNARHGTLVAGQTAPALISGPSGVPALSFGQSGNQLILPVPVSAENLDLFLVWRPTATSTSHGLIAARSTAGAAQTDPSVNTFYNSTLINQVSGGGTVQQVASPTITANTWLISRIGIDTATATAVRQLTVSNNGGTAATATPTAFTPATGNVLSIGVGQADIAEVVVFSKLVGADEHTVNAYLGTTYTIPVGAN